MIDSLRLAPLTPAGDEVDARPLAPAREAELRAWKHIRELRPPLLGP